MYRSPLRIVAVAAIALAAAVRLVMPDAAVAARKEAPTGREIAEKAKAAKFDAAKTTTAALGDKRIKITPAAAGRSNKLEDFEAGQVLGRIETEFAGDETGLPPGKYHLFVAKVGGDWRCYAESDGVVVKEAVRVRLEAGGGRPDAQGPDSGKPKFEGKGWCIRWSLAFWSWRTCF